MFGLEKVEDLVKARQLQNGARVAAQAVQSEARFGGPGKLQPLNERGDARAVDIPDLAHVDQDALRAAPDLAQQGLAQTGRRIEVYVPGTIDDGDILHIADLDFHLSGQPRVGGT